MITITGKNTMLDALPITQVVAYSGDPEGDGVVVSTQPATAQFDPATNGQLNLTAAVELAINENSTVDHLAYISDTGTILCVSEIDAIEYVQLGYLRITTAEIDLNLVCDV